MNIKAFYKCPKGCVYTNTSISIKKLQKIYNKVNFKKKAVLHELLGIASHKHRHTHAHPAQHISVNEFMKHPPKEKEK